MCSTTGKNVLLEHAGYALEWIRRDPNIYSVLAKRAAEATKLEWIVDSDFRFFPAIRDDTFGYVLHPADLAANKVTAVWAAAVKALGFTPEGIIDEIRRNAPYSGADFLRVNSDPPVDSAAIMIRLRGSYAHGKGRLAISTGRQSRSARPRQSGQLPNPRRPTPRPLAQQFRNHRRHV